MPFTLQFIHPSQLGTGADEEDLPWAPVYHRGQPLTFDSWAAANDERSSYEADDDGYAYRVKEVAA